jgi:hypothetical protein
MVGVAMDILPGPKQCLLIFGGQLPGFSCFRLRQSFDHDERWGLALAAETDLRLAVSLEHMDMGRFVVCGPDDEPEPVGQEHGRHCPLYPTG